MSTDFYMCCKKCKVREIIFKWDVEEFNEFNLKFYYKHASHGDIIIIDEHNKQIDDFKSMYLRK